MAFKMKGFNFPGTNQGGNENMADGRSKSSAFQKKDNKLIEDLKKSMARGAAVGVAEAGLEAISGQIGSGMKPKLKLNKSVKQKLIPKSRYTGRKPQSQMTDTEYIEMLYKKSKKPKLKLKKSVKQKTIKSPLKSKDSAKKIKRPKGYYKDGKKITKEEYDAAFGNDSTKKIKRPKGYYKDGKRITKEEYDRLTATAKRNVSVVSKKKK